MLRNVWRWARAYTIPHRAHPTRTYLSGLFHGSPGAVATAWQDPLIPGGHWGGGTDRWKRGRTAFGKGPVASLSFHSRLAFWSGPSRAVPAASSTDPGEPRTDSVPTSPIIRQYLRIRHEYPGYVLLFRSGDFYELFFDDAVKVSNALGLTLTQRGKHRGRPVPIAGVPAHVVETYIGRILRAGFSVAVAEQTETVASRMARKSRVLSRKVTRLVTPGTLVEERFLDPGQHNYLAGVWAGPGPIGNVRNRNNDGGSSNNGARRILGSPGNRGAIRGDPDAWECGLAWCDVSTGDVGVMSSTARRAAADLAWVGPSELLVSLRTHTHFTETTSGVWSALLAGKIPGIPSPRVCLTTDAVFASDPPSSSAASDTDSSKASVDALDRTIPGRFVPSTPIMEGQVPVENGQVDEGSGNGVGAIASGVLADLRAPACVSWEAGRALLFGPTAEETEAWAISPAEERALTGVVRYVLHTHCGETVPRLLAPVRHLEGGRIRVDAPTLANLEVLCARDTGRREGSLLGVLDATRTAGGARLLRERLTAPSADLTEIQERLDLVTYFVGAGSTPQPSQPRSGTAVAWRPGPPHPTRAVGTGDPDTSRSEPRSDGAGNDSTPDPIHTDQATEDLERGSPPLSGTIGGNPGPDLPAAATLADELASAAAFAARGTYAFRDLVQRSLRHSPDLSRCLQRLVVGRWSPRDLGAVRDALDIGLHLARLLGGARPHEGSAPDQAGEDRRTAGDVTLPSRWCGRWGAVSTALGSGGLDQMLSAALVPFPAAAQPNGDEDYIASGYDCELDRFREQRGHSDRAPEALVARYRSETGIPILRIRRLRNRGFFVEVPRGRRAAVADLAGFQSSGDLAAVSRFRTAELDLLEVSLLRAADAARAREQEVAGALVAEVVAAGAALTRLAQLLDELDVAVALAHTAVRDGHVRPQVDQSLDFEVVVGQHPTVASGISSGVTPGPGMFQANTCCLSPPQTFVLVTGPNMGGKSVFLKQNALIALIAQAGAYVPARRARIGLVDRIFSRVGASDNLGQDQSTFMVEMVETAHILRSASPRSLVVVDELGRGTAASEGLALAWAVGVALVQDLRARTLFATHYTELIALATRFPSQVQAVRADVQTYGGTLVFTHRLLPVPKATPPHAIPAYAIHIARYAGFPEHITRRAYSILRAIHKASEPLRLDKALLDGVEEHEDHPHGPEM